MKARSLLDKTEGTNTSVLPFQYTELDQFFSNLSETMLADFAAKSFQDDDTRDAHTIGRAVAMRKLSVFLDYDDVPETQMECESVTGRLFVDGSEVINWQAPVQGGDVVEGSEPEIVKSFCDQQKELQPTVEFFTRVDNEIRNYFASARRDRVHLLLDPSQAYRIGTDVTCPAEIRERHLHSFGTVVSLDYSARSVAITGHEARETAYALTACGRSLENREVSLTAPQRSEALEAWPTNRFTHIPRSEMEQAYASAMAADESFHSELERLFGDDAGDVRYTPEGKGKPGSQLYNLNTAFLEASARLQYVFEKRREEATALFNPCSVIDRAQESRKTIINPTVATNLSPKNYEYTHQEPSHQNHI